MVSINPKLVSQLNLKQTTVKASNKEDSKATGNKVDSTGQPYNPGKSAGDLKADTLIVNRGIKIGGGKPLDVEAPKAEEQSHHVAANREELRNMLNAFVAANKSAHIYYREGDKCYMYCVAMDPFHGRGREHGPYSMSSEDFAEATKFHFG